jgi:hypothetical protein
MQTTAAPPVAKLPRLGPSPGQLIFFRLFFLPYLGALVYLLLATASQWRATMTEPAASGGIGGAVMGYLAALSAGVFFGSYFSSSYVRAVALTPHEIAYRTGAAAYAVPAQDINGVRYMEGGRGWKYIVVSTGSKLYTIANFTWSDKSFAALKDQIWAWSREAAPGAELSEGNAFNPERPQDKAFQNYIYSECLHYALIVLALGAVVTAACFAFNLDAPNAPNHWSFIAAKPAKPAPLPSPPVALRSNTARLRCDASAQGFLSNCIVLEESPPGRGVGAAAVEMASRAQIRPPQRDGHQVASVVIFPMAWKSRN